MTHCCMVKPRPSAISECLKEAPRQGAGILPDNRYKMNVLGGSAVAVDGEGPARQPHRTSQPVEWSLIGNQCTASQSPAIGLVTRAQAPSAMPRIANEINDAPDNSCLDEETPSCGKVLPNCSDSQHRGRVWDLFRVGEPARIRGGQRDDKGARGLVTALQGHNQRATGCNILDWRSTWTPPSPVRRYDEE